MNKYVRVLNMKAYKLGFYFKNHLSKIYLFRKNILLRYFYKKNILKVSIYSISDYLS